MGSPRSPDLLRGLAAAWALWCIAACRGGGPPPSGSGTTGTTGTTGASGDTGSTAATATTGTTGTSSDVGATSGTTTGPDFGCGDGVLGDDLCFAPRKLLDDKLVVGDLAVTDFDGDGLPDGLVAADDGFYVVWSDGGGAVALEAAFVGDAATAVTAMAPDAASARVAVAYEGIPRVVVHGSGADRTVGVKTTVNLTRGASALVAGDVTGDGEDDIVVAEAGVDADLLLAEAVAGGTFLQPVVIFGGATYGGLAAGLLGTDTVVDLAFTDLSAGRLFVGLAMGGGGFDVSDYGPFGAPGGIAVANLDGDMYVDVALADAQTSRVAFLPGTAAGALVSPATVAAPPGARHVVVGDFDGDGDPDLAAAGTQGGGIYVYRWDPVAKVLDVAQVAEIPAGVAALGAGDLTDDGVDDLLVGAGGLGGLWFVRSDP